MAARDLLAAREHRTGILLLEQLKPYAEVAEQVAALLPKKGCKLVFLEEEIRAGGFGMMLSDALIRRGSMRDRPYAILATDDSFVCQARQEPIYRTAGVDAHAIAAEIRRLLP